MNLWGWLVWVAALCTWYGFASRMRRSFRLADQWTIAKTVLVASGWLCTLIQLAALLYWPTHQFHTALAACSLYGLAYLLFWWALRAHGRAKPAFVFTQPSPSSFCRCGPYRYIRHPLYAAYLLAWSVPPLVTQQWWLLATTVWMALLYTVAAHQEEHAFAQSPFAQEYQHYRRQAGMFWPRPITLIGEFLILCRKLFAPRSLSTSNEAARVPEPNHDAHHYRDSSRQDRTAA
jgi:protein-S-isoprenylcysteine O-methyltransferase Ste14